MIPISDDNPARITPFVTWGLIAANVLVFLWQLTPGAAGERLFYLYGFIPALLFTDLALRPELGAPAPAVTLLTSMFLHGGLLHLAGNMLYLWIFGNNVEDAMGHVRFAVFYVLCGVGAALAHGATDPASQIPMVGASGAISGVLGAYLLLYPRVKVTVVLPLGVILYPMQVSAVIVLGFWFLAQLVSAALSDPNAPGVAWWAHVAGFAAGIVLTPFFKSARVPLFGRTRPGPWG